MRVSFYCQTDLKLLALLLKPELGLHTSLLTGVRLRVSWARMRLKVLINTPRPTLKLLIPESACLGSGLQDLWFHAWQFSLLLQYEGKSGKFTAFLKRLLDKEFWWNQHQQLHQKQKMRTDWGCTYKALEKIDRCIESNADPLHPLAWFPSPSSPEGFTPSIEKNLAETSAIKGRLHGLLTGLFYLILAPYVIFLPRSSVTVPHWNQSVKSLREGKLLSASEDLSSPTPGPLHWALQKQSNLVTEGGRLTEIMTFRGLDYFEDQSMFDPRSDTGFLIAARGAHWVASASFLLTPPSNQHSLETMLSKTWGQYRPPLQGRVSNSSQ